MRGWRDPTSSLRYAPTCYAGPDGTTMPSPGIEKRWHPTALTRAASICAVGSSSAADRASGTAAVAQFTVEIQRPARSTCELAAGGSRDAAGRDQQHLGQR